MTGTAAWVARTEISSIDVGRDTAEELALARDFLMCLREGDIAPAEGELDDAALDVLQAAIEVIAGAGLEDAEGAVQDACRLRDFISAAEWSEPDFVERAELLAACSVWAWRLARRAGKPAVADAFAVRIAASEGSIAKIIHDFRADPLETRERRAKELRLEDPEILLAVCKLLRDGLERSPSEVRDDAEHLYRFLTEPRREIGIFDEREYFLGELALLAGTACRILARKSDASRWFDLSEANFRLTVNAVADWSRVSYHRLALRLEEREFDGLLEQLPSLAESFRKLDMLEDGVKCRFLEALALMETGEAGTAARAFESILEDSRRLASEKLVAIAYVNLVHVYGMLGETERALQCSLEALPILKSLDDRVNYAKVKAGIGALLRASGQLAASVEAYRDAQGTFAELQMHADVAANALIIADLSLQLGKEDVAIREIVAALPVIEEYSMVPEGMAALALLRESVRQRKVNHQALNDLRGFFEDSVS